MEFWYLTKVKPLLAFLAVSIINITLRDVIYYVFKKMLIERALALYHSHIRGPHFKNNVVCWGESNRNDEGVHNLYPSTLEKIRQENNRVVACHQLFERDNKIILLCSKGQSKIKEKLWWEYFF